MLHVSILSKTSLILGIVIKNTRKMSIEHLVEYSTAVEYSDDTKISIFQKYDVWALIRTFSHVNILGTR